MAAAIAQAQQRPSDENHPGKEVYETHCAFCHQEEGGDAPATESIRRLSKANIKYTVELGYMRQYAKDIPKDQLAQLVDWLPKDQVDASAWRAKAACPAGKAAVNLANQPRTVTGFGLGLDNTREQPTRETGLSKADMKNLELAYVIAFPQTATMRSQPVIVGDTMFMAATDSGHIYAFDVDSGCLKWTYEADMTLRSSLTFAEATRTTGELIIAGDAGGKVHAIDAKSGREVWVKDIKLSDVNRITGAPVAKDGIVYVPLSAIEVNFTAVDEYECCIGQGAVVAMDVATGRTLWVGRTMEDAKPTFKDKNGSQKHGPSGAIIWSSPAIDTKRGLVYAGTGENTSWPATDTSDAIIAYDIKTGARKWVFQATKADIWNYACGRRGPNCDWPGEYQSPDHDFGGSPMLIRLKDGTERVVAGQKSGVLWALDPDTGKLLWSNKASRGSAGGGVRWGIAYDGERIFMPSNDGGQASPTENPNFGPGIHAVNAMTGEIEWTYKPNARDCGDATQPVAAVTRPQGAQRITRISAPVLPPARVNTQGQAQGAGRAAQAQGAQAGRGGAAQTAGGRPAVRCRVGMAAAPLVVDGAVVTGTNGGMLRIFDGATGEILFEYQTNRPYPNTVNGVEGRGGSIDSHPYVAANGTLFVQSGYARFGQPPGNVLLAFRPKGRTAR
jgi:polyvinyl alcohol dehydrogenase (cytochrome)